MCPREWSPTANGRYRGMRYGGIAATARQAVANAAATAGATNPTPCMCRAGRSRRLDRHALPASPSLHRAARTTQQPLDAASVALDLSPSTQAADRPFDRRPAVCMHVPPQRRRCSPLLRLLQVLCTACRPVIALTCRAA
ncbi:hypothetical protein XFF6166_20017 [Xanthomonas citri pv. fuscans]|nr:hypothetical protein XFF6166_20017 [Xanthomonas citri pv. fuscans]SOO29891.1 hypothetical protein XAP6164_3760004 [Xanthomonas phaseoli pv. phaseoli]SON99145.1 hypothetical protein XFF6960_130047 [Xanthomonas citri pv. fuscans]SOO05594.1 hypothetical protein XFF7767_450048 [Xanthomonas citri pv. fuscans]SOO08863.1 hypothetical protein XFF6970_30017 [Xanthomonas citri pv. fuscans]